MPALTLPIEELQLGQELFTDSYARITLTAFYEDERY
jgi:hypothetical protein